MIRFRIMVPWMAVFAIVFTARAMFRSATEDRPTKQLARSSEVYRKGMKRREATAISSDRWSEFQLNYSSRRTRVLTNAVVSRRSALSETKVERPLEDPRRGWRYAIDYELLDDSRNPMDKSTYHFRSQTEQWIDPETGETHFSVRLDKPAFAVAQTKVMQFANNPLAQPAYLRLRLGKGDDAVEGVYVRVFDQLQRPEFDKNKTWVRMSKLQRERLCTNSVFSSDLLSIEERQNLLRLMWVPAVKHNNFPTENLFFIDQRTIAREEEVTLAAKPKGVLTDSQTWLSFAVPNSAGTIRIRSDTNEGNAPYHAESTSQTIQVRYQCRDADDQLSTETSFVSGDAIDFPGEGGLLVLKSTGPVRSQITWTSADPFDAAPIVLAPSVSRSRTFLVDENPLVFDVHVADDQPTPFKLVLRVSDDSMLQRKRTRGEGSTFDDEGDLVAERTDSTVVCELLDRQGDLVKSFNVQCSPVPSPLDRLEMFGRTGSVSKPTLRYFLSPRSVAQIRLKTEGNRVLASLLNRPPGLDQVLHVGDVKKENLSEVNPEVRSSRRPMQPAWFAIRPRSYDRLISRNRSFLISAHRRPIDRDPDILAGRYQWHRFEPVGTWIGKDSMISHDMASVNRASDQEFSVEPNARGALSQFWRLSPNRNWTFHAYPFEAHVRASGKPKLIVLSDRPIGRVSLRINDELWMSRNLSSRRGEINLDRPFPSQGTIRIESEKHARFFLRGCVVNTAPSFRRRTLQSFPGRLSGTGKTESVRPTALTYQYRKLSNATELVSVKFYRPMNSSREMKASRLRISLEAPHPLRLGGDHLAKDWTIRSRAYVIDPPRHSDSVILDSGQSLGQPATCFFRFKSDLPRGDYRLVIEATENADDGFVLVSQTLPGESPQRYLHP